MGPLKRLLAAGAGLLLAAGLGLTQLTGPPAPVPLWAAQGASAPVSCSLTGSIPAVHGALTGPEVAQAAFAAGFRGRDLVIAVAVAHAESGWNPTVTNKNTNGSIDYGLFEINSVHEELLARGRWDLATDNAAMAFQVWQDAGGSWSPWVTYWSGSYLPFMDMAEDAVAHIGGKTDICSTSGSTLADPGPGQQDASGLRPRAAEVKAYTVANWGCSAHPQPCVSSIGGFAARTIAGTSTLSDHATGRAVDLMLPADYHSAGAQSLGFTMSRFYASHLAEFGGHYVIFNRQIFSTEHPLWRPYVHPSGGHSDTLDHVNHVHVSVN